MVIFPELYALLFCKKVSTSLLRKYDTKAKFAEQEFDMESKPIDFENRSTSKYLNTKMGLLIQEKVARVVDKQNGAAVKTATTFHDPELAKYILSTFGGTCSLWSGFFAERTSNAHAEAHNKKIKKDIMESKSRVKAGRFVKKSRANTLASLKLINLGIKTKATKKTQIHDYHEQWKKSHKKPDYFHKVKGSGTNIGSEKILLTNPENVEATQSLWLNSWVFFLMIFT